MDLLLLALRPMILPDPGMQRVFVHSELARGLRASLLRLDGQFDCALLEFSGILSRRGLAHRTHLVYCVSSLSPCVRKSITTSSVLRVALSWAIGVLSPRPIPAGPCATPDRSSHHHASYVCSA